MKGSNRPYISLADFDLANQEIRNELLRHTGQEYNTVIAADITSEEAGSKKVDISLGRAYQGLNIGTRAATTIFLYSFSGGQERGATLGEIKRCATTTDNFSSVVAEAVGQLKGKLFYLQDRGDRFVFSNQPNLNRILLTRMENIGDPDLEEAELLLLQESIKGGNLKAFIWEENSSNIPDTGDLKLIILKNQDKKLIQDILENKGQTRRVYRNTIFFLCPMESERSGFINALKRRIAYQRIGEDKDINLTDEQRKDIKKELDNADKSSKDIIHRLYRMIIIPGKNSAIKEIDLGVPTYGDRSGFNQAVYDRLRSEGDILEKVAPLVIKEKYLSNNEYVLTEQLYESMLKTPGEPRPTSKAVIQQGISDGIKIGLFGLGELEEDKPKYVKESTTAALYGKEIVIGENLLKKLIEEDKTPEPEPIINVIDKPIIDTDTGGKGGTEVVKSKKSVQLRLQIPKGKVSDVMKMVNLLDSKFNTLNIEVTATDGEISEHDYENKIEETLRQLGIKF